MPQKEVVAIGDLETIRCVLDHGHVKLISVMGGDATIVAAARNSISGKDVKATSDDRALIRYLMRMKHTTPFESVVFTFELKLPIFVARQLVRHRTQALNEMSARYGVLPEEFYVPELPAIQYQAEKNKQGRNDRVMDTATSHQFRFREEALHAFVEYQKRLDDGMARELARINLPLSTYTVWWSTLSLHNLLHMLGLRMDPHAQYEARVYAEAMAEFVKMVCPMTWEAFEDFRLNAVTLSAQDIEGLRSYLGLRESLAYGGVTDEDLSKLRSSFKTKREHDEFLGKLKRIFG